MTIQNSGVSSSKAIHNRNRHPFLVATGLLLVCACFWLLRLRYWGITKEEPFSDMADYLAIADRFRCCWSLAQSDFWVSYAKPTLPALAGFLFSATGGINLDVWRFSLATFTFLSLLWLARELYLKTGKHSYPIALIGCVALSKSSIFWSYKFATEGLGEALIYLVCAALLFVQRTKDSVGYSFILGASSILALFNRPNLILVIPVIALMAGTQLTLSKRAVALRLKVISGFTLGCVAIIAPLALRSLSLYGSIAIAPTQGPYSFLWELGAVPVTLPSGEKTTRTAQQLQEEAPKLFANDRQASVYAKSVVRDWVVENWNNLYPRLIRNRLFSSIEQRDIALSKVPRVKLFPGRLERILIDKSPVLFIIGSLGLIILALRFHNALFILGASALLPWAFGIFFMGDPRMLEPSLPLILFGCAAVVVVIGECGCTALGHFLARICADKPTRLQSDG
jgi:hypothetical protein